MNLIILAFYESNFNILLIIKVENSSLDYWGRGKPPKAGASVNWLLFGTRTQTSVFMRVQLLGFVESIN